MSTLGLRVGVWLGDLQAGVRQGLEWGRAAQLECVGLDAFGAELAPRALSGTGRRDLVHLLRSAGLRLAAVRADTGGRRLTDAAALEVNLTRLREAFELARALGAPRVVVPLGYIPPEKEDGAARARGSLAEALSVLGTFAGQLGIRPVAQAGAEPAAALEAFLKAHDAAGFFQVDLHPGAVVSRGEQAPAALNVLSSRVALATATDAYRGGAEAPFGQGDVPWGELLVSLSVLARDEALAVLAACSRECDRPAALAATVTRLRKLVRNPLGA